jgi:iron complex transport system substrate-binding protein
MGNPFMTAASPSLVQDWMELAGVLNVAESWKIAGASGMGAKNADMEQIIAANPDVIICMNPEDVNTIKASPAWKSIQAVKAAKYMSIPGNVSLVPRNSQKKRCSFFGWQNSITRPISGISIWEETRAFYENFYGFSLSDEDIQLFLNPLRKY